MKIKIKDIEKNLPYKIKRNFRSIGIDTAQTTGLIMLTANQEYIKIEHFVLGFKTNKQTEIYHTMVKTFERLFEEDQFAVIEEVFVGFSKAGSVELAKYGAFAIAECIKQDMKYATISAKSCRAKFKINTSKCGKGKSKEVVGEWIKDNLNIDFCDNNLNDALILALCGICENFDFRSQAAIDKERKGLKGKKESVKKKTMRKK